MSGMLACSRQSIGFLKRVSFRRVREAVSSHYKGILSCEMKILPSECSICRGWQKKIAEVSPRSTDRFTLVGFDLQDTPLRGFYFGKCDLQHTVFKGGSRLFRFNLGG